MTRANRSALLVLTLPHLLGGCATSAPECDPSQADFFNNTGCLASGAYDQRQAQLQRELSLEQRRNREFRMVLAALEEEKAGVRAGLRASQARYGKLDRAWESLRRDLEQGHAKNTALERQIASIDQQMERRKSTATTDVERKIRARDDLQRRLSLLQQEVDAGVYER
jgi:chromosome segregation ATPase